MAEQGVHRNPCCLMYKRPQSRVSMKYSEDVRWNVNAELSYSVALTREMGPHCYIYVPDVPGGPTLGETSRL